MTYNDLYVLISEMTSEERESHVTVLDSILDEFIPIAALTHATEDTQILDAGHPYLTT